MERFKPQSYEDYRKLLNKWIVHFYDKYLAEFD